MDKLDLDSVFAGPAGADAGPPPPLDGPEAPADDGSETEATLDAAIDDVFATEDPVQRREAFKRACALCKESDY